VSSHDAICERLARSPGLDATAVEVVATDGDGVLQGAVADRAMKRAIEDAADTVHGVRDIDNRIRVVRGVGA